MQAEVAETAVSELAFGHVVEVESCFVQIVLQGLSNVAEFDRRVGGERQARLDPRASGGVHGGNAGGIRLGFELYEFALQAMERGVLRKEYARQQEAQECGMHLSCDCRSFLGRCN